MKRILLFLLLLITPIYAQFQQPRTSDSIGIDVGSGSFSNYLYPSYLREGSNVTFTVSGDTLTIASTASGGSGNRTVFLNIDHSDSASSAVRPLYVIPYTDGSILVSFTHNLSGADTAYLQTSLGTSITTGEITNSTILPADLNSYNVGPESSIVVYKYDAGVWKFAFIPLKDFFIFWDSTEIADGTVALKSLSLAARDSMYKNKIDTGSTVGIEGYPRVITARPTSNVVLTLSTNGDTVRITSRVPPDSATYVNNGSTTYSSRDFGIRIRPGTGISINRVDSTGFGINAFNIATTLGIDITSTEIVNSTIIPVDIDNSSGNNWVFGRVFRNSVSSIVLDSEFITLGKFITVLPIIGDTAKEHYIQVDSTGSNNYRSSAKLYVQPSTNITFTRKGDTLEISATGAGGSGTGDTVLIFNANTGGSSITSLSNTISIRPSTRIQISLINDTAYFSVDTANVVNQEAIQDKAGPLFSGNESGILVTYDDGGGAVRCTVQATTDNIVDLTITGADLNQSKRILITYPWGGDTLVAKNQLSTQIYVDNADALLTTNINFGRVTDDTLKWNSVSASYSNDSVGINNVFSDSTGVNNMLNDSTVWNRSDSIGLDLDGNGTTDGYIISKSVPKILREGTNVTFTLISDSVLVIAATGGGGGSGTDTVTFYATVTADSIRNIGNNNIRLMPFTGITMTKVTGDTMQISANLGISVSSSEIDNNTIIPADIDNGTGNSWILGRVFRNSTSGVLVDSEFVNKRYADSSASVRFDTTGDNIFDRRTPEVRFREGPGMQLSLSTSPESCIVIGKDTTLFEWFYLDKVAGWNRATSDSTLLNDNVIIGLNGDTTILALDSSGTLTGTPRNDTFMVWGVAPCSLYMDSIEFLYRSATSCTLTTPQFKGPRKASNNRENLIDSTYYLNATKRFSTSWTRIQMPIGHYVRSGDRFGLKIVNIFGASNRGIKLAWARVRYKERR